MIGETEGTYDAGPGHPLSGCGKDAVAKTAMEHYLEAERCLVRERINEPKVWPELDREASLHYMAAIAASLVERGSPEPPQYVSPP